MILYGCIPRFFSAIEIKRDGICLPIPCRRFWSRVRNRDWWQLTLVVFSPECDVLFPAIVSNLCIITGVFHVIHVCQKRMRTLVRAAILLLM